MAKPRYSTAEIERIRQSLEAGESPAAIAQREGCSYSAIITLKHRLGVEGATRERIAELQTVQGRLAGDVSSLGSRRRDLEKAVNELESRRGTLALAVKGLELKKGNLEQAILQLEQIRLPQLVEAFRRQLIQAGWIPPGTVPADTILWGEAAKGIWKLLGERG
ncbi:MAG: hypothetical protein HY673_00545 [Chloroflexi bacterium]|nr:hypothetical protein [Chloroflexota bacterium]